MTTTRIALAFAGVLAAFVFIDYLSWHSAYAGCLSKRAYTQTVCENRATVASWMF